MEDMEMRMRDYTPDELLRGRFLRHFMGLDHRNDDPTEEQEALPAEDLTPPKTRETKRPTRLRPSNDLSH